MEDTTLSFACSDSVSSESCRVSQAPKIEATAADQTRSRSPAGTTAVRPPSEQQLQMLDQAADDWKVQPRVQPRNPSPRYRQQALEAYMQPLGHRSGIVVDSARISSSSSAQGPQLGRANREQCARQEGESLRVPGPAAEPDSAHELHLVSALNLLSDDSAAGMTFPVPRVLIRNDLACPSPAEVLADQCLQNGCISSQQLRELVQLLPCKPVGRHQAEHIAPPQEGRGIQFGGWVRGSQAGVMGNTRQFPQVTQLLSSMVRCLRPSGFFTTVFFSLNVPSGLHRDPNNHPDIENTIIPLGPFTGGELFEQDDHGSHQLDISGMKGQIKPVTMPFTSLKAKNWHQVLLWSGDRFVLGAYHIRDPWRLSAHDKQHLKEMGMRLWL